SARTWPILPYVQVAPDLQDATSSPTEERGLTRWNPSHGTAAFPHARGPARSSTPSAATAPPGRPGDRGLAPLRVPPGQPPAVGSQRIQGRAELYPAAGAGGGGMDPGDRSPGPRPAAARRRLVGGLSGPRPQFP